MVFVDGHATTQMEIPELANHIGVVLADYDTQLVTMTVREEVAFAMENRGYDRETIKARSEEVFKQVGLVGLEDRKITSFIWWSTPTFSYRFRIGYESNRTCS